jgi:hypothetical protein
MSKKAEELRRAILIREHKDKWTQADYQWRYKKIAELRRLDLLETIEQAERDLNMFTKQAG